MPGRSAKQSGLQPASAVDDGTPYPRATLMIPEKLTTAELEEVYDLIAAGIDRAGPEKAPLFLAKLALALAALSADTALITQAIEAAQLDL